MEKIGFLTDSAADVPHSLCEKYDIGVAPVHLTIGGKTYREYYDITPEEFWDILTNDSEIPATSQVTPVEWLHFLQEKQEKGCTHVAVFTMNGEGSGGYRSACLAKEDFYDQYGKDMVIEIFDSRNYSYIYGRVIVEAAELAQQGESFASLCQIIRDKLSRIEGYLGVYDLKVIRKSGRISGAAALVGGALGLKPVSHVFDGGVPVCDKVRGGKALLDKMIQRTKERVDHPENQTGYLVYAKAPAADLDLLEKRMREEIGFQNVERIPLGASITANSGPQALATAYYGRPH